MKLHWMPSEVGKLAKVEKGSSIQQAMEKDKLETRLSGQRRSQFPWDLSSMPRLKVEGEN